MPYIKPSRRGDLEPALPRPQNVGELNYIITRFCIEYIHGLREYKNTVAGHKLSNPHQAGPNYQAFNDVLGVLTAIQHELYRRMIAPYEDKKIKENGDVY